MRQQREGVCRATATLQEMNARCHDPVLWMRTAASNLRHQILSMRISAPSGFTGMLSVITSVSSPMLVLFCIL